MIKTKFYKTREDGVNLYLTQSDSGFYIINDQTGGKYASAVDIENIGYTYTETNEKISDDVEVTPEEAMEQLEAIL